jgi:CheY-like chemotaxis protein
MIVQSEPGVGSTFSFTVPIVPPPDENEGEDEPDTETADMAYTHPTRHAPVVLAVENDPATIDLYQRYLSRVGYDVIGTTRPDEIPNLVHTHIPSVIVLDVNMPEHDGWAVLQHLKQGGITSEIPVVICSMNPDSERGLQLGAAEYVVKPFTEEKLQDAVQKAQATGTRARILIVDDKPETIRAFREALEAHGQYELLEVTSGQQALDLIQLSLHFDLVILDLRMPGIDGFDVLQALRSNTSTAHVPVLVLTAEDISADERSSLQATTIYRKDNLNEDRLLEKVADQLENKPGEKA